MKTEIGEFVVGAYLKQRLGCDFIDYNVRPPAAGVAGLGEIDVVGLNFRKRTAFLCEVATHLDGLHYGGRNVDSVDRVRKKLDRQRKYAKRYLSTFEHRFMFWSPYVPKGRLTKGLRTYTTHIKELRQDAAATTKDTGNPFFRALQILEHLRPVSGGAPSK
jgi:hypothetical protein